MRRKTLVKGKKEQEFAQANKSIKNICLLSGCILVVFLIVGMIATLVNRSYAAITATSLPETFTSNIDANFLREIGTIEFQTGFTGTHSGGSLTDIYCIEHRLVMMGDVNYQKAGSVLGYYPGLVYILDNNDFGTSDSNLNQYLTQIAVWWYLDLVNGYDDDKNYIGANEVWMGTETTEEDKYQTSGDLSSYRFYNNLSVLDKEAIKADTRYGEAIINLVKGALNYQDTSASNVLHDIDSSKITYTITDDYIETNDIPVTSDGNFMGYQVTSNSSDAVIVNSSGVEQREFRPGESFRIRYSVSAIKNNQVSISVSVTGSFKTLNAYLYNPVSSDYQRTVMGLVENTTDMKDLNLDYEIEFGKAKIVKRDAADGGNVEGATLVITDDTGKEVVKFASGEKPKELILPVGNYTLTETVVPEGYQAETTTKQFTVIKDQTVEVVLDNTPTMDVPDTGISATIIYIVGGAIVVLGIILIVMASRPKSGKKKK